MNSVLNTASQVAFFTFVGLYIVFRLRIRRSIQRRYSNARLKYVHQLRDQRKYAKIVQHYEKRARRARRHSHRDNLRGLAALWGHDPNTRVSTDVG